jgi:hypothetical protein
MKKYCFTLKHDTGITNFVIPAKDIKTAIDMCLKIENAPENAILNIKVFDK